MSGPHIDFTVRDDFLEDDVRTLLKNFRPKWKSDEVWIQSYTGGITNKLLGCFYKNEENDVVLVRVFGPKSDLIIDRNLELKTINYLHLDGLASTMYGTFNNGFVYEYLHGVVITKETCHSETVVEKVAKRLADFHTLKPKHIEKEPILWPFLIKLMSLVPSKFSDNKTDRRFRKLFPQKLRLEKEYVFLEKELNNNKSPLVFCHNDLLLGNIVFNQETSVVHFIDFEYAGYNYQAYDIANHFNEYQGVEDFDESMYPDEEFQKKWLKIYLEHFHRRSGYCDKIQIKDLDLNMLYALVQKYTLASHFLWGVWGLFQAEFGLKDEFDYLKFAHDRLGAYNKKKMELFPS